MLYKHFVCVERERERARERYSIYIYIYICCVFLQLIQSYLSLKREYSMAEYLFTVSDKKLRKHVDRTQADDRDGQTQTNMAAPGAEIVFTL